MATTYRIFKDKELKAEFKGQENDHKAFAFILRNQSQSVNWALKYEGWKVEETNEETGKISYWKHYA